MKSIAPFLVALLAASAAWAGPADDSIAEGREALAARDVVKAMAAFTRALDADPRNVAAIGEPKSAVADFTTAILGDPAFGRAYVGRARAKLALDDGKSAIADFDEAIAVAPQDFEVHVARAAFRVRIGNLAGARVDLTNAKAVADEATALKIGEMLERLGN